MEQHNSDNTLTIELEKRIINWIESTCKELVEYPNEIEIKTEKKIKGNGRTLIVMINCNDKDNGKLIGKHGEVISAIRRITVSMLGTLNKRINILVMD